MRIEAAGAVPNQAKVADVAQIQPRQTSEAVEPDRDADDRQLASARMDASKTQVKKMENWEGMGNWVDTTA
jgi:hypothetical protein